MRLTLVSILRLLFAERLPRISDKNGVTLLFFLRMIHETRQISKHVCCLALGKSYIKQNDRRQFRFSLSTINHIRSLICNLITTKGFSFYKKHTFDFASNIFCNMLHFIFQYFDSACQICHLIRYYKLVLLWNCSFFWQSLSRKLPNYQTT